MSDDSALQRIFLPTPHTYIRLYTNVVKDVACLLLLLLLLQCRLATMRLAPISLTDEPCSHSCVPLCRTELLLLFEKLYKQEERLSDIVVYSKLNLNLSYMEDQPWDAEHMETEIDMAIRRFDDNGGTLHNLHIPYPNLT